MTEYCGYYGRYQGKLLGDNWVTYVIDEAFDKSVERNKKKLLLHVKEDFSEYIQSIKSQLKDLTKRIEQLEKIKKSRKKNE